MLRLVPPLALLLGVVVRESRAFNNRLRALSARYGQVTARIVRSLAIVGVIYVLLIAVAGWRFLATPSGFIPNQDQGYLIGVVQLPPGASLQRTDAVVKQSETMFALGRHAEHVKALEAIREVVE